MWKSLTSTDSSWRARQDEFQSVAFFPEGIDQLYTLECGGGGDCLFHVIAKGYEEWYHSQGKEEEHRPLDVITVRTWASSAINKNNVDQIIRSYQQEWFEDYIWKEHTGFRSPWVVWPQHPDAWDPSLWGGTLSYRFPNDNPSIPVELKHQLVKQEFLPPNMVARYTDIDHPQFLFNAEPMVLCTKREKEKLAKGEMAEEDTLETRLESANSFKVQALRRIIQTPGEKFRGDDHVLDWLTQSPDSPIYQDNLGFIVFTDQGLINCSFYPATVSRQNYMLLYNQHHYHWKLLSVELKRESIKKSTFAVSELPLIVKWIWLKDYILDLPSLKELEKTHPMYDSVLVEQIKEKLN